MATLKYSRQRESIKEFLMTRKDHPTADVVYENVRKIYPNISLGTVYRNLSLLSELGEIQKLSNFGGADHFDGCTILNTATSCVKNVERFWTWKQKIRMKLLKKRSKTFQVKSQNAIYAFSEYKLNA